MRDLNEFKDGLRERKGHVVIAASDCVRHAKREMMKALKDPTDDDKLLEALSQTRFNPVYQQQLIEAVMDLHDFEVGGGKYQRQ